MRGQRGRPLVFGPEIERRFFQNVFVRKSGCWLWVGRAGPKPHHNYGKFTVGNRQIRAHRFMWELHEGPIPAGMQVCHHCDQPLCVRPDHLFLGTQLDNVRDALSKGRMVQSDPWSACMRGHPFTPENTHIDRKGGQQHCRTCRREADRRRKARLRRARVFQRVFVS